VIRQQIGGGARARDPDEGMVIARARQDRLGGA
jgi:hypothetical protein